MIFLRKEKYIIQLTVDNDARKKLEIINSKE